MVNIYADLVRSGGAPAWSRYSTTACARRRLRSAGGSSGTSAGFTLSSGMASSFHGDAFFAWDDAALGHRVKDCIVQKAKCNTAGGF